MATFDFRFNFINCVLAILPVCGRTKIMNNIDNALTTFYIIGAVMAIVAALIIIFLKRK
jgi:hypothetical protein